MRQGARLVIACAGWVVAATVMSPRADLPSLVQDELHADAPAVAEVRLANGVPDAQLELVAGRQLAFSEVGYRDVTEYAEVGGGAVLALRTADGRIVARSRAAIEAGRRYMVVATRDASGQALITVVPDGMGEAAPFVAPEPVEEERTMFVAARY